MTCYSVLYPKFGSLPSSKKWLKSYHFFFKVSTSIPIFLLVNRTSTQYFPKNCYNDNCVRQKRYFLSEDLNSPEFVRWSLCERYSSYSRSAYKLWSYLLRTFQRLFVASGGTHSEKHLWEKVAAVTFGDMVSVSTWMGQASQEEFLRVRTEIELILVEEEERKTGEELSTWWVFGNS